MKQAVQAKLLEERSRLGAAEFEKRQREWRDRSDEPLARWWRSLGRKNLSPTGENVG